MPIRIVVALLAVSLVGCESTRKETHEEGAVRCCRPVVYPPYRGPIPAVTAPGGKLPDDPGPGLLFTRIVYSIETNSAFAYLVHASETGTRLLAIVGPLASEKDYQQFYLATGAAYCKHGPGTRWGCSEGNRSGGAEGGKKPLTPIPPPAPPPPLTAVATQMSQQQGPVDTTSAQVAGDATGPAGAALPVLSGY
ncbi:MAG TPA: hypothetical protein VMH40_17360 [Myxococcaceae bacterium]|nr:hypothetical protein [Myxococcaceae bacterium]